MQPLYTTAQIRSIEQAADDAGLMEKAGLAAATRVSNLLGNEGDRVLVIAGPGNNGGDALVAARHLKASWHCVDVLLAAPVDSLPPDAKAACDAWLAAGGTLHQEIPPKPYDLVIDGLFGIGLSRPLEGYYAALVKTINALGLPVLALDVPSGLCSDTGRVLGSAVQASHTLTFIGAKPGLFTLDGPDHAGVVHVCDLGLSPVSNLRPGLLMDAPPPLPPRRRQNSHKGSHGAVGVLGGDTGMTGAALLAGRAALLAGAGRVYCGLLGDSPPAVDYGQPELMLRHGKTLLEIDHLSTLVVGPGMGRSAHAITLLQRALRYPAPLLLDADALQLLAGDPALQARLHERPDASLLTPHPGEAAALLNCAIADIQSDRIASALRIAESTHAVTVLKGCGSVIATPDGRWYINGSGNPGMASAGMGDILSGLIAALLAQGMAALDAALLGVYLHGAAADSLVRSGVGPAGLTASEVALEARHLLNQWNT